MKSEAHSSDSYFYTYVYYWTEQMDTAFKLKTQTEDSKDSAGSKTTSIADLNET